MYISGLSQENTKTERSMQHTLSYLPCDTTLEVDHTLYYDLPAQGQRYISRRQTFLPPLLSNFNAGSFGKADGASPMLSVRRTTIAFSCRSGRMV